MMPIQQMAHRGSSIFYCLMSHLALGHLLSGNDERMPIQHINSANGERVLEAPDANVDNVI